MKKIIPLFGMMIMVTGCKKDSETAPVIDKSATASFVADINEPGASTVTIGSQTWMKKNLTVTHYRNGDKIPQVKHNAGWKKLTTGAWCWYNNDSTNVVYGKLYNWYAVNDPRGLAPIGWHIPSDAEWATLSTFLGGDAVAGGKMKETGTDHWLSPNTGATNSSGFTGLPGSNRISDGSFYFAGQYYGFWWSSTPYDAINAWYRRLNYADAEVTRNIGNIKDGFSVRCIHE